MTTASLTTLPFMFARTAAHRAEHAPLKAGSTDAPLSEKDKYLGSTEPALEWMFTDPTMISLLESDGLSAQYVHSEMVKVSRSLQQG
jgi:hypothetical protein